jgi:uncharacterized protein
MCPENPRFVRCPEPLSPLFCASEKALGGFFSGIESSPEVGQLTISGERYILARAATFSVELRRILEEEYGRLAAEKLAYSLGRAAGTKDAEFFIEKLKLERGPEALSAGPVHFAFVGWAFVDISPESSPASDESFFLLYDHPYSFEADSYKREGIRAERPVCHMNAGYSSGWCQVSFGMKLVAKEITCRAAGHDKCTFVMAPPATLNERVVEWQDRLGIA